MGHAIFIRPAPPPPPPPTYGRHNLIIPTRTLSESDILTTINFNGNGISILPTRACRNLRLHRLLQGRWKLRDLACVASVSVRFRRKELGTRVKDRAKNGASERGGRGREERLGSWVFKIPGFVCKRSLLSLPPFHVLALVPFLARPKPVFLCSETKRKRLLRRLWEIWGL